MRVKFRFISNSQIVLPKNFNQTMQGLVYKLLDKVSATWLHEEGFKFEKRSFKLFTFSSIQEKGRFDKRDNVFVFPKEVTFYLSSPIEWIVEQIAKNSVMNEKIQLGENDLQLVSLEVMEKERIEDEKVRINTLTPIEVHSTPMLPNGKKLTYYYNPTEGDFSKLTCKRSGAYCTKKGVHIT